MKYSPERLAYWYFRLNGFLTTENFIVHPDRGMNQQTDADLIAVRFNCRAENLEVPMTDDPRVAECDRFANVIIAEIKTGRCALNGPWTRPERQNMERVLAAIGCISDRSVKDAAACLYQHGRWQDETVCVRLFALGEKKADLSIAEEQQVTWNELIQFCIDRIRAYRKQKSSVGQWPDDGQGLQRLALNEDVAGIREMFCLAAGGEAHV